MARGNSIGAHSARLVTFLSFLLLTVGSRSAPAQFLQAGDADRNTVVDQFDFIRVLQAGKFLTGQSATWGEGDWNGVAWRSPENPPPGDGAFNQMDLVVVNCSDGGEQYPQMYPPEDLASRLQPYTNWSEENISLGYEADSGRVWIEPSPGSELTSVSVTSSPAFSSVDFRRISWVFSMPFAVP